MAMNIPAVSFNEASPEVNFGQIQDVYIAQLDNPLATLLQATLEGRIDNADAATETAIRKLAVIGDKPQPEATEVSISHDRIYKAPRKHTLNFKVDETDELNYTFMNTMIANSVNTVLIWYRTDNKFYGGTEGVEASITLDHIIPESLEEPETIVGKVTWTSNTYPSRADYPLPSA